MVVESRPVLDYGSPPRRRIRSRVWAVLIVMLVFLARVSLLHRATTPGGRIVPTAMTVAQTAPAGIDMQMGNALNHNSEGENVLYVDGHIVPTTQPFAGETRGTNSNAWLDNIYTVPASNLSSSGGVMNGLPFDDKDAIMVPTEH